MLQESVIYRFVYSIFSYFAEIGPESLIACILKKIGTFFKAIFSGSSIVNFVMRDGSIGRSYEGSLLFRIIDGLLNLPQRLLHPLYKKAEPVFQENFLFKWALFLLDRIHLLVAVFLFVVLIVPHQYFYNVYSTIAIVALLALYFMRTVVDGKTGFHTGAFNVFLVFFIACVVFAEVFSIMPHESLRFLAFYLTCFMLVLLLIGTIRSKRNMNEALAVVLVGMSLAGVYGVYQKIIGVPVNPAWVDTTVNQGDLTRVWSFYYNPNNFAEIILLFLPFYFASAFNTTNILKKLAYLALAAPPFLSLILTQARSAWIAFVLAGFVYVFFKAKRLIPVFILLGIAAIPFLPQSIMHRIATITNPEDSSSQTRVQVWQTVLPILKDYWFTGLGLGNETLLRVSKNYYIFVDKGSIPSHSHNLYLQVWLETGFPGILAFLAFMLDLVKKSIKALYQKLRNVYINNILIAGLAALTGILAMGMVEYVWFYQRVMLFFWAVVGIMLAALNIGDQEAAQAMDGSAGKSGLNGQEEPEEEEQEVAV